MDSEKYYNKILVNPKKENSFRILTRFKQTFPYILKEGNLLDVGCGGGYWLNFLDKRTKLSLFGVDISPNRIKSALNNINKEKIDLTTADIQNLPFPNNYFEQTTALEVLEHVLDWEKGLSELIRVTSNRIIITVPYNQEIIKTKCPNCSGETHLYGHIHKFTENSFKESKESKIKNITLKKLPPAFNLEDYISQAIKGIKKRTKTIIKKNNENGHAKTTICSNCYNKIEYHKHFEISLDRIRKILMHSPEYLLIQIEK